MIRPELGLVWRRSRLTSCQSQIVVELIETGEGLGELLKLLLLTPGISIAQDVLPWLALLVYRATTPMKAEDVPSGNPLMAFDCQWPSFALDNEVLPDCSGSVPDESL